MSGITLNKGMFSSNSAHWNTPEDVLACVRKIAVDGDIDLDPCSNGGSIVNASVSWFGIDETDDGLNLSWDLNLDRPTLAYVNPPYGDVIGDWVEKVNKEAMRGVEIVALLPARTDTVYFHNFITMADAMVFWKGRLKFLGGKSCAPFPSMLAYWGPRSLEFRKAFSTRGFTFSV